MGKETITCKLTGIRGPGVDAHIIPESFYQFSKSNRESQSIFPLDGSSIRKRSPKGLYDQKIVTIEGERYFNDCDRYANKLLIQRGKEAKAYTDRKSILAMELFEYDYHLLKFFAISMLWRANVSDLDFFKLVKVGSRHEQILRERILNNDPGDIDDYTVILAFYEDVPDTGFGFMSPWSERRAKVRFYQFQLAYWIMFIKVDKVKCPSVMRDLALSPNQSFRAINLGRYSKTKTFRNLVLPNLHSRKT